MMKDMMGKTQRGGEKQSAAEESLLLSFPLHFPSDGRSKLRGNEGEEDEELSTSALKQKIR